MRAKLVKLVKRGGRGRKALPTTILYENANNPIGKVNTFGILSFLFALLGACMCLVTFTEKLQLKIIFDRQNHKFKYFRWFCHHCESNMSFCHSKLHLQSLQKVMNKFKTFSSLINYVNHVNHVHLSMIQCS